MTSISSSIEPKLCIYLKKSGCVLMSNHLPNITTCFLFPYAERIMHWRIVVLEGIMNASPGAGAEIFF